MGGGMRPIESPVPYDQYFPGPVGASKMRQSVLRQQGANFLEGREGRRNNTRLKKHTEGPRSQIDINCSKEFQPRHWRRPQVDVAAKISRIDINGSNPLPPDKRPALKQVNAPFQDTPIFTPGVNQNYSKPSLKPSANGYDQTSGIFTQQHGAYQEPKGFGYGNKVHQPLNDMLMHA